jgi:predicted SPOUT superfamily RNA methylase MTH1
VKLKSGADMQAIHVYYSKQLNDHLPFQSLLNGMEEEGVPSFVKEKPDHSSLELGWQAAIESRLGVGIGIGKDGQIVLHYTKLAQNQPLFTIDMNEASKQRVLGTNAARLVKGFPFRSFDEFNEFVEKPEEPITEADIVKIVTIVLKRLQDLGLKEGDFSWRYKL